MTVNYIWVSPYFSINFFIYYKEIIQLVSSTSMYCELGTYRKNNVSTISTAYVIKSEFLSMSLLLLQPHLLHIRLHVLPGQVLFASSWIKHESMPLCLRPAVSPNLSDKPNHVFQLRLPFSKGEANFHSSTHLSTQ